VETWLQEKEEAQALKEGHETPAFFVRPSLPPFLPPSLPPTLQEKGTALSFSFNPLVSLSLTPPPSLPPSLPPSFPLVHGGASPAQEDEGHGPTPGPQAGKEGWREGGRGREAGGREGTGG